MWLAVFLLLLQININIGKPSNLNHNDPPSYNYNRPTPPMPVCTSKGCVRAAYTIMQSMDDKIQPCDDFYEFACGNWKKTHTIPPAMGEYNMFVQLGDILTLDIKNLLEILKDDPYEPFMKTAIYYQSCMNEEVLNEIKGQPLIEHLKLTIGGWPVIEKNWDEKSFNWIRALANLRFYDARLLILSFVGPDAKDNVKNIMSIDQTNFGISGDYLIYKSYKPQRQAYYNYMTETAAALKSAPLTKDEENEILDILKFEQRLAKITSAHETRTNFSRLYNPMTFEEMKRRYENYIDFDTYFKLILADTTPLQNNEKVIVNELEYFEKLGKLISNTTKRTIANYLGWRVSQMLSSLLSEEFRQIQSRYAKALTGSEITSERWKTCALAAILDLPFSTGKIYTDAHFTQNSKNSIDSLLQDLRKEFESILKNNDWMDMNTKDYALKKLKAMIYQIGYPEKYQNPAALEEEFQDIHMTNETYFQNKISSLNSNSKRHLKGLRKPVDKTEWVSGPADINAKNDILRNSLLFPAAFLQPPIFDADRPRSLNYGSVGMVIGHEITHGFDNQGKQFGIDGNLEEWWSETADENFQTKANCLINQYGDYTIPEIKLKVNGNSTIAENIADNAGIKEAYLAFKRSEQEYGIEPLLPGLNFNHDQLFFLSFANTWCGISRPEQLKYDRLIDVHSPLKFRVNGPVSNSKDFQRTFNCPNNSKMVRQVPCNVW